MKKYIIPIVVVIFSLLFIVSETVLNDKINKKANNVNEGGVMLTGKHYVEIDIKDNGIVKVELDADNAPITVTNFIKLVNEGFYNNLTFHRIIKGFMVQGGDPLHNGTGGSSNTIKGEFKNNGVNNKITHKRGVISMARSLNKDSASSQFFIMHADEPHLDGDYAAFGIVIEGMNIIDNIANNAIVIDNNGTVELQNQPIINSIKVVQ